MEIKIELRKCVLCRFEFDDCGDNEEFCYECETKINSTFNSMIDEIETEDAIVLDFDSLADDLKSNKIETLTKKELEKYFIYY
jgi:hypothetical protein